MQTTLRLDDELYRDVKSAAAREGVTITRYLEDALRNRLAGGELKPAAQRRLRLPVSKRRGGLADGVMDLKDAANVMDGDVLARR